MRVAAWKANPCMVGTSAPPYQQVQARDSVLVEWPSFLIYFIKMVHQVTKGQSPVKAEKIKNVLRYFENFLKKHGNEIRHHSSAPHATDSKTVLAGMKADFELVDFPEEVIDYYLRLFEANESSTSSDDLLEKVVFLTRNYSDPALLAQRQLLIEQGIAPPLVPAQLEKETDDVALPSSQSEQSTAPPQVPAQPDMETDYAARLDIVPLHITQLEEQLEKYGIDASRARAMISGPYFGPLLDAHKDALSAGQATADIERQLIRRIQYTTNILILLASNKENLDAFIHRMTFWTLQEHLTPYNNDRITAWLGSYYTCFEYLTHVQEGLSRSKGQKPAAVELLSQNAMAFLCQLSPEDLENLATVFSVDRDMGYLTSSEVQQYLRQSTPAVHPWNVQVRATALRRMHDYGLLGNDDVSFLYFQTVMTAQQSAAVSELLSFLAQVTPQQRVFPDTDLEWYLSQMAAAQDPLVFVAYYHEYSAYGMPVTEKSDKARFAKYVDAPGYIYFMIMNTLGPMIAMNDYHWSNEPTEAFIKLVQGRFRHHRGYAIRCWFSSYVPPLDHSFQAPIAQSVLTRLMEAKSDPQRILTVVHKLKDLGFEDSIDSPFLDYLSKQDLTESLVDGLDKLHGAGLHFKNSRPWLEAAFQIQGDCTQFFDSVVDIEQEFKNYMATQNFHDAGSLWTVLNGHNDTQKHFAELFLSRINQQPGLVALDEQVKKVLNGRPKPTARNVAAIDDNPNDPGKQSLLPLKSNIATKLTEKENDIHALCGIGGISRWFQSTRENQKIATLRAARDALDEVTTQPNSTQALLAAHNRFFDLLASVKANPLYSDVSSFNYHGSETKKLCWAAIQTLRKTVIGQHPGNEAQKTVALNLDMFLSKKVIECDLDCRAIFKASSGIQNITALIKGQHRDDERSYVQVMLFIYSYNTFGKQSLPMKLALALEITSTVFAKRALDDLRAGRQVSEDLLHALNILSKAKALQSSPVLPLVNQVVAMACGPATPAAAAEADSGAPYCKRI